MGIYTNFSNNRMPSHYTEVEPFVGEHFNYHSLGIIAASEIAANHNSFMKNYFGKTNDAISLAIDTAKVVLSSAEIFYLAKGVKAYVLTTANGVVSFLASINDVLQINDKLEKGEKITDKLRLNIASNFSIPQDKVSR